LNIENNRIIYINLLYNLFQLNSEYYLYAPGPGVGFTFSKGPFLIAFPNDYYTTDL